MTKLSLIPAIFLIVGLFHGAFAVDSTSSTSPKSAAALYFPPGELRDHASFDAVMLKQMDEPSLCCGQNTADEVYRFLWSSSFDGVVAVRIERRGDKITFRRITLPAHDKPDSGLSIREGELPAEVWTRLSERLNDVDFWKANSNWKIGLDGSGWLFEGAKAARYHAVWRWSPRDDEPIDKLGSLFFSTGQVDLPLY